VPGANPNAVDSQSTAPRTSGYTSTGITGAAGIERLAFKRLSATRTRATAAGR
jgi:hypothetical protein